MRWIILILLLFPLLTACLSDDDADEQSTPTEARPTEISVGDPTPTPPPEVVIDVEEWAFRQPRNETPTYVYGEILNSGPGDAQSIAINVTLFDDEGNTIAEQEAATRPILNAGESSPFEAVFTDLNSLDIDGLDFEIEAEHHDPDSYLGQFIVQDLDVTDIEWGDNVITGTVANSSDEPSSTVFLMILAYEVDGSIFGVERYILPTESLNSGESTSFQIDLNEKYRGIPVLAEAYAWGQRHY